MARVNILSQTTNNPTMETGFKTNNMVKEERLRSNVIKEKQKRLLSMMACSVMERRKAKV
eukprot:CAMPEP_0116873494 /NCGR_PEP_ID=MMETSP0463-20121206/4660_1 /TAXON_ID=181622 /ORGANISM="Strombidinopsis sp, Strain SopsisLIS2011" /LENGTH=59 /DNA_ID=CAMNT_0004515603 /DNA_START=174 /DNA_END=353 /DNA_ORIENTATION=-